MSDFKEALELIQQTAEMAQKAVIHTLPGDGRKVYVQLKGKLDCYDVPPPIRRHIVHTLTDLVAYAERAYASSSRAVLWHGSSGVILVIDDADQRDTVTFPLTLSERFRKLQQLVKDRTMFIQDRFVRLLRLDLGIDNLVIAKFRKLDWENSDKGTGNVQHGDVRIAKSVIAKVQGIDELPDTLPVVIPVYQQVGERQEYIVRCAVEIDAVNRTFQLVPLPDELEAVCDLAQANIADRLAEQVGDDVPIYYGEP